jgi:hypothetical protein
MNDRDDDDYAYSDTWFDLVAALLLLALIASLGVGSWLILGMESVK